MNLKKKNQYSNYIKQMSQVDIKQNQLSLKAQEKEQEGNIKQILKDLKTQVLSNSWEIEGQKKQIITNLQVKQKYSKKQQLGKFMKISDLKSSTRYYSVLVKVLKCMQQKAYFSSLPYVKVLLADQTGSAYGFFKGQNCQYFKVGNTLAIRNGRINIFKGHISLQMGDSGRITEQDINFEENTMNNISQKQVQTYHKKFYGNKERFYPNYNREKSYENQSYSNYQQNHRYQRNNNKNKGSSRSSKKNSYKNYHGNQRRGLFQQNFQNKSFHNKYQVRQDFQFNSNRIGNNVKKQDRRQTNRNIPYEASQKNRSRSISQASKSNTKYKKIGNLRHNDRFSLVAMIMRIKKSPGYVRVSLKDETGQIQGFLPYHDEIFIENIVVIHNLKILQVIAGDRIPVIHQASFSYEEILKIKFSY